MDHFTSSNVSNLRFDFSKALESVAKEHNIKINLGNIRYSETECTIKVICVSTKDEEGNLLSPLESAYKTAQELNPNMLNLGEQFLSATGDLFKIVGWKPRNRKYPLIAKSLKGKQYKFPRRFAFKPNE